MTWEAGDVAGEEAAEYRRHWRKEEEGRFPEAMRGRERGGRRRAVNRMAFLASISSSYYV